MNFRIELLAAQNKIRNNIQPQSHHVRFLKLILKKRSGNLSLRLAQFETPP